jgi:hypothetical protein
MNKDPKHLLEVEPILEFGLLKKKSNPRKSKSPWRSHKAIVNISLKFRALENQIKTPM